MRLLFFAKIRHFVGQLGLRVLPVAIICLHNASCEMPKAKVSATIVGSHVGACATSDCEISFESDAGLAPTAVDAAGVFQVSEGKSTANAVFISENSTLVIKGYAIVASTATCLAQDPRPNLHHEATSNQRCLRYG